MENNRLYRRLIFCFPVLRHEMLSSCSACPVCAEETTTRNPCVPCTTCPDPGSRPCVRCAREWITTDTEVAPRCPCCLGAWDAKFVRSTFGTSFVRNEFASHRRDTLAKMAIAHMPNLQRVANVVRDVESLRQASKANAKVLADLKRQREGMPVAPHPMFESGVGREEVDGFLARVDVESLVKAAQLRADAYSHALRRGMQAVDRCLTEVVKPRSDKGGGGGGGGGGGVVCPCPRGGEGCRGFVTSATWACGMCRVPVCPQCLEEAAEGTTPHVCDPRTVASAAVIRRECKPCPTCSAFIQKSSGCAHMYCIACRTGFDWNTLKVMDKTDGFFHNPHFSEEETRRRPLESTDDAGLEAAVLRTHGHVPDGYSKCRTFLRVARHAIDTEFHVDADHEEKERLLLVARFMAGLVESDALKRKLWLREKSESFKAEVAGTLRTLCEAVVDAWTCSRDLRAVQADLEAARDRANEALISIEAAYQNGVPYVRDGWSLCTVTSRCKRPRE